MFLAIDIGNTNIKFGLYRGEERVVVWRIATERQRLTDEYAVVIRNLFALHGYDMHAISGCALSCVVPALADVFADLVRQYLRVEPVIIGPGTKTGMRLLIDTPRELGADRVAHAVAAYHTYGGPVIVVELGTATVFDVVNGDGDYVGGAIAPGMAVSAEALSNVAAKLYQVALVPPPRVIGKNTVHYMQSGIVYGYAGLVEGLIRRMWRELGTRTTVVATGGIAPVIMDVLRSDAPVIDHYEPHMVLKGLRLIYNINRGQGIENREQGTQR